MEALEGLQSESFEFVFRKKMEDLLRIWVAPYKLRMLRFLSESESESETCLSVRKRFGAS